MEQMRDLKNHFLKIQNIETDSGRFCDTLPIMKGHILREIFSIVKEYRSKQLNFTQHLFNEMITKLDDKVLDGFENIEIDPSFLHQRPSIQMAAVAISVFFQVNFLKNSLVDMSRISEFNKLLLKYEIHKKIILSKSDVIKLTEIIIDELIPESFPSHYIFTLVENIYRCWIHNLRFYILTQDKNGLIKTSTSISIISQINSVPPWIDEFPDNIQELAIGKFVNFWYRVENPIPHSTGTTPMLGTQYIPNRNQTTIICTLSEIEKNNFIAYDILKSGSIVSISKSDFVCQIPEIARVY